MQGILQITICLLMSATFLGCSKKTSDPNPPPPPPPPANFSASLISVDGINNASVYTNTNTSPSIKLFFTAPLKASTVPTAVSITDKSGASIAFNTSFQNNDSTLVIVPAPALQFLNRYTVSVSTGLKSKSEGALQAAVSFLIHTKLDSSDKFPRVSDDALLTLIQRQTFKYFWDFAHPVSGLARERNTSGDVVTSGGSGFGIMAIVTGINRQFITRAEGLARMQKIVDFLKTKAERFHGAFPHWLNGSTGKVIPFSTKDDGADLVETSYLVQGLLAARQYFNGMDTNETNLRNDINTLWNAVEWSWFRKNNENVLYWHYSDKYTWEMNHPVRGWNECLITYVLAASSPGHSIPKIVYDNGWANNGGFKNGNTYYNIQLPLGPAYGGPLFFAHYSFHGINPKNLQDAYADYWAQNTAHTLINYNYCKANPKSFNGYGNACWGLTASDNNKGGYSAHAPDNDLGIISPTAAISSIPYTPLESMEALRFFYYKLGDKIWKEYGFVDAFNLTDAWFADSFLAIDQGPEIIMIENYRTGLLWNLFMSCPEVKTGMRNLGFQSPNL